MTSVVKNPQGKTYPVKNLGWLLRHLSVSIANRIEVRSAASDQPDGVQWLMVYFEDGYLYASTFEDPLVLKEWLSNRRTLVGVSLYWHDEQQPADWQRLFAAQYLASLEW
jgi:hypothetical protein